LKKVDEYYLKLGHCCKVDGYSFVCKRLL